MSRPNHSTEQASLIVDALVAAGVVEFVLCPGSRSSALAYAARSAERAGRLRLHVRVDERSAGFLALGLGKVSRRPAVVITTSGTAVANLHPAVLEAHHALVPLIVLSADRPAELRGTGANQTTVQPGIFAGACRDEADLAPETETTELLAHVADAVAAATQPGFCGPVHLNVQFREPLVPDLSRNVRQVQAPEATTLSDAVAGSSRNVRQVQAPEATTLSDAVGERAHLPGRTLVVLGDLPTLADAAAVLDWAAGQGVPVLTEPFGPHPRGAAVPLGVLVAGVEEFVAAHEPDVVVVVGRPTLSRPISRLIRRTVPALVLVDDGLELDVPTRESVRMSLQDLMACGVDADPGWADAWLSAGRRVADRVTAEPPEWGTGPALARTLVGAIPHEALVFVGSSNTPRDLEVATVIGHPMDIVGSRGLAGIDGCVSTAIGLALSQPDRPTVAVLGDLTFLHDSGGLVIGPDEPRPDLTIVVANDDGGGIFTTLEPGEPERSDDFERLFGTPTQTDLEALCRAHGIPHERVESAAELEGALGRGARGIRVIEVPIERNSHRSERARLAALAADALS